jgi:hypothetical protein
MSFGFEETVGRMRAGTAQWDPMGKLFKEPKSFYEVSVVIGTASLHMFAGGATGACIWLLYPGH